MIAVFGFFRSRTARAALTAACIAGVGCHTDVVEDVGVDEVTAASSGHGVVSEDASRDMLNRSPNNRPTAPMVYPDVYFQPAVTGGPGSCGYTAVSNILRLWLPRDHVHYEGYTPQWVMGEIGYRVPTGMLHSDASRFLSSDARPPEVSAGGWDYMTGAFIWNDTGWERVLDYLRAGRPWGVSLNNCKWGDWSASRAALLEDECMANRFWGIPNSHWVVLAGARGEGDSRQILIMEGGNYTWIPWGNFELRMDVAAARYATFYPTEGRAATHLVVPENAQGRAPARRGGADGSPECLAYRTAHPHDICGGPCDCAGTDEELAVVLCESDETCRVARRRGVPSLNDAYGGAYGAVVPL